MRRFQSPNLNVCNRRGKLESMEKTYANRENMQTPHGNYQEQARNQWLWCDATLTTANHWTDLLTAISFVPPDCVHIFSTAAPGLLFFWHCMLNNTIWLAYALLFKMHYNTFNVSHWNHSLGLLHVTYKLNCKKMFLHKTELALFTLLPTGICSGTAAMFMTTLVNLALKIVLHFSVGQDIFMKQAVSNEWLMSMSNKVVILTLNRFQNQIHQNCLLITSAAD